MCLRCVCKASYGEHHLKKGGRFEEPLLVMKKWNKGVKLNKADFKILELNVSSCVLSISLIFSVLYENFFMSLLRS